MKNLFIDSNIWLSLYHFTNDDLAQFRKLKDIIGKDINLIIPIQEYNEIVRNRENKLKDALERFSINNINYPVFSKGYDEYSSFKQDYSEIQKRFNAWNRIIKEDIKDRNLPADILIREFLETTGLTPCDSYINNAEIRYKIGNPPGKDNKYGDAINWECLLSVVPDGEDLYLISADQDYQSSIFKGSLHSFLQMEWEEKKKSKIYYYTNLVKFLGEHFKDIELKTEKEKQDLIEQLKNCDSFKKIQSIISKLFDYSGWTNSQIEEICSAVEDNPQVGRILGDTDILSFFSMLLGSLDYFSLEDSSTKRVMYQVFEDAIECEKEMRRIKKSGGTVACN